MKYRYSFTVGELYSVTLTVTSTVFLSSTSTTVILAIESSDLVAIVSGGDMQAARPGDMVVLDASSSYDENMNMAITTTTERIAAVNSYSFQWTCVQIQPILSAECGFDIVNATTTLPYLINLQANAVSPGSKSEVSVTVVDGSGSRSRSSSAIVYVIGLAAGEPIVSLVAMSPAYMNAKSVVKLRGTVDAAALGTSVWSVDSAGIDLTNNNVLLTSQSNSFQGGKSDSYFVLAPNVLGDRMSFTFSLTATLTVGMSTSFASVDIETNGPPLPGIYTVTPSEGMALQVSGVDV